MANRKKAGMSTRQIWLGVLVGLAVLVIIGLLTLPTMLAVQEAYETCITGYAESGQRVQAIATNNLQGCDTSDDPGFCKAIIQQNPAYCDSLDLNDQGDCKVYFGDELALPDCSRPPGYCMAVLTKNVSQCDTEECRAFLTLDSTWFSPESRKQGCKDRAYVEVALAKGKPRLCRKIQNPDQKERCQS